MDAKGAAPAVRVSTLESGMRVASQYMPGLETVSLGVWVNAGARNESADVNGVSHLLEHMAFKGTRRRDAFAIAAEIEAVGGHINAYTSREHTAYFAKMLKEDLPLAVDLLGDILLNSTFADEELAREKDVVIQEIGQANDTPDDIVFDHFQEAAYPGQSIGRPVLGSTDRISELDRGALKAYLGSRYTAPQTVLAAAGRLDHDRLVALAEEAFGAMPRAPAPAVDEARYRGGESRVVRALEQAHLVLGVEGVAYEDAAFADLQVLSNLLGGGMSSRLFQEVREKRGLAYSIFSFATSYVDGGLFGVYAGTGPEECGTLVSVISDQLRAAADRIDDDELGRAKAQLRAGVLMSLESPFSRCEQIARQMLIYGEPKDVGETVRRIDAVDARAVRECMARLLAGGRPTVAALGPLAGLPDYDAVAAGLN